jgi:Transcription factor WhiB
MTDHEAQAALGRPPERRDRRRQRRGQATEKEVSWAFVRERAQCAVSALDCDEWFPVSKQTAQARREAAAAIAVCAACPARAECLALSLADWKIGQHGIWGGLVAAERAVLRQMTFHDSGGGPHLAGRGRTVL